MSRLMRVAIVFLPFLALSLAGCGARDIRSNPKRVSGHDGDSLVHAQGRWLAVAGTDSLSMIPRVNAVEVTCDRRKGECLEARASLVTPDDDGVSADFGALFTHIERYQITSFADGVLVARAAGLAYDLELRIDIKSQSAQRFARETAARGATMVDATRLLEWVLR